MINIIEVAFEV